MGIQDAIDNIAKGISNVVENVKDAASEATHRSVAQGEQAKRDIAGDSMPASEHLGSIANQVKEETLAGVDSAKQDIRNNI